MINCVRCFVFRVFSDRLIDANDHEAFVALLSDKLGTMFDLTFHNLCPNKQPPIFGKLLSLPGSKTFSLANHRVADNLVNQSEQQSQSRLLGHLTVFLPSQCWCARFGELTAINNIGRTRRRARSEIKLRWVDVSQLFLSETVGFTRCNLRRKKARKKCKSGA